MTDEIDTNLPEQIWAYQENAQWKERGWSPEPITYGGAQEYVRADLYDAERQRAERLEAEKKTYESGWLEAEGLISDLRARAERAEEALSELASECECPPAYSGRGKQDPHCPAGLFGDIACEGLGLPPRCQYNRAALRQDEGGE